MAQGEKDPLIGQRLRDKWHIDGVLGRGGMGSVYAATHRNGLRGAIKILHRHLSAHDALSARFVREGTTANRVGHAGVVRVLDDDVTDDGLAFIVMELLEGETWRTRWMAAGKRLPLADVLPTALAVLDILEAAHASGVLHRDIKPDNVFLTTSGEVKLLDFGIARVRELSVEGTETGTMLGTPAFMSPEQALARWSEVDESSDLFSVAASMWMLLTGKPVHAFASGPETLVAAATRPAAPIRALHPDVPADVAAVIDRALQFERRQRFSSAREMRDALATASGEGLRGATVSLAVVSEQPHEKREGVKPVLATIEDETVGSAAPPATPRARVAIEKGAVGEVGSAPPPSASVDETVASAGVEPAGAPRAVVAAATQGESGKPNIIWPMLAGAAVAIVAGAGALLWTRSGETTPRSEGAQSSQPTADAESTLRAQVPPTSPTQVQNSASPPDTSVRPPDTPSATSTVPTANPSASPTPAGKFKKGCMCRAPDPNGAAACAAFERIECNCQGEFVVFPTPDPGNRIFTFPPATGLAALESKPCHGFDSSGHHATGKLSCRAECSVRETFDGVQGGACRGISRDGVMSNGKLDCSWVR